MALGDGIAVGQVDLRSAEDGAFVLSLMNAGLDEPSGVDATSDAGAYYIPDWTGDRAAAVRPFHLSGQR